LKDFIIYFGNLKNNKHQSDWNFIKPSEINELSPAGTWQQDNLLSVEMPATIQYWRLGTGTPQSCKQFLH
jgi:hypothetical protein